MTSEIVLANARIVTREEVILGSVLVREGRIASVDPGPARGQDLGGDYLLPGLVELHTDNLEKHYSPRIGVVWDPVAAAIAHDVQCTGSGITTVFDSLVLGAAPGWEMRDAWLRPMLDGLACARDARMLKASHYLHLRCEMTHPEIVAHVERLVDEPALGLLSLMDHAPGDRQSPDIGAYKERYRKAFGMDEAAIEAHVAALIEGSRRHAPGNRRAIAGIATTRQLPLASHDDASRAHVEEAAALGAVLTEFPTTLAAAQAAGELGIAVLMGAPNLIRGGSHAGNVAAATLAEAGHLDILSSDYIPSALLQAAFRLSEGELGQSLPGAVAKVTAAPAAAVGLGDRGVVAPGYRADLIRVQLVEGRALVRAVWVEGERVA